MAWTRTRLCSGSTSSVTPPRVKRGLIDEYRCYVKEYREDDGVPEGYKALLFNRYMRTAYSVSDEIPAFKAFYEKWYG